MQSGIIVQLLHANITNLLGIPEDILRDLGSVKGLGSLPHGPANDALQLLQCSLESPSLLYLLQQHSKAELHFLF